MLDIMIGLLSGIFWAISGSLLGCIKNSFDNFIEILFFAVFIAAIHDLSAGVSLFFLNYFGKKWSLYRETLFHPEFPKLVAGSLLGGPVGMLGYVIGVYLAGVSKALLVTALYPLVSTLLSIWITKESPKKSTFLAVMLSVAGVYCATYLSSFSGLTLMELWGLGLTFLAVIGWSLEGNLSFLVTKEIDSDVAIGYRELISGFVLLLFYLIASVVYQFKFNATIAWEYAVLAGIAGGISYRFWYQCIALTGVPKAMVLNITYVFWGTLFSYLQTNSFDYMILLGDFLIVVSVFIIIYPQKVNFLRINSRL